MHKGPDKDPLEKAAVLALRQARVQEAKSDLAGALSTYERLDDLGGQWRIHYLKTTLALAEADQTLAASEMRVLEQLAAQLSDTEINFRTQLLAGRVTHDHADFTAAEKSASSPLEQALAKTYLGDTAAAIKLIDPDADDHPADRAFVYYRRAMDARSAELFEKSLKYYRLSQDSRGIADTLVNLARIGAESGNKAVARGYASRAITVLTASGDKARASEIQKWMASL
ncbi:MAG TPA: hypothetical protein VJ998_05650 [Pseudomonadales bacterium]|nr:hypothetical protein [Pseudomonadales bacterium]